MLTSKEFAEIVIEYLSDKTLDEDNGASFASGVIIPWLEGRIKSYIQQAAKRRGAGDGFNDKIDEGNECSFALDVINALKKRFPKVPAGADKRDYDFEENGMWWNYAIGYYRSVKSSGMASSSSKSERLKAIQRQGTKANIKLTHDGGLYGRPLSWNSAYKSIQTEESYFNY